MNVIVIIRIACLALFAIHASYTDFRYGVVKNRSMAMGCIVAIVLIIVDAVANAGEGVLVELINIAIAFILGVFLYILHIWGAGDAKLLLLFALLFPPQLYFPYDKVIACSIIIPIAFACSFLYLFVDSLVHFLSGKEGIEREVSIRNMKKLVFRWSVCVLSIMLANQLLLIAWPSAAAFPWLRILINLCVVFICTSNHGIQNKSLLVVLAVANVGAVFIDPKAFVTRFMWLNYLLALFFILLRVFIDRYNYTSVLASDLKPGMVLSNASALRLTQMNNSDVSFTTTEDVRSKLAWMDIEAIQIMGDGIGRIEVVRRIPFAVFLSVGAIMCLVLGVISK